MDMIWEGMIVIQLEDCQVWKRFDKWVEKEFKGMDGLCINDTFIRAVNTEIKVCIDKSCKINYVPIMLK